MKQQLTKEQSRRLIELGVPTEKASASVVEETQGDGHSWTYPVFTIGDLLDVLPKFNRGRLTIMRDNDKWAVGNMYDLNDNKDSVYQGGVWKLVSRKKELIDALFEFVVYFVKTYK